MFRYPVLYKIVLLYLYKIRNQKKMSSTRHIQSQYCPDTLDNVNEVIPIQVISLYLNRYIFVSDLKIDWSYANICVATKKCAF